ncbi:MAG: LytTR family transcriptional regulator [Lewinellaceae bacterium]|nr:LytTR family transcriptional regulator [Lewinellaceae bacterium]
MPSRFFIAAGMTNQSFALVVFLASLCFGVLSTFSATVMSLAHGETIDALWVLNLSFYYLLPGFLWPILTPLILFLARRWPILKSDFWRRNLVRHLLFALVLAPLFRLLAIALDFTLKESVGLIDVPAYEVIYEVRYIILASAPEAIITYFFILGIYLLWRQYQSLLVPAAEGRQEEKIKAQYGGKAFFLAVKDILWVEADGNYVNLYTKDKRYRQRSTLSGINKRLGQGQFFRIHRSFIVNREAVANLKHWRRGEYLIELKNRRTLTSSRGYRKELLALLESSR